LLWQRKFQAKQLTYHLNGEAANPLEAIKGDNGGIPRNRLILLTLLRFVATPRTFTFDHLPTTNTQSQQQSPSISSQCETKKSSSENQQC